MGMAKEQPGATLTPSSLPAEVEEFLIERVDAALSMRLDTMHIAQHDRSPSMESVKLSAMAEKQLETALHRFQGFESRLAEVQICLAAHEMRSVDNKGLAASEDLADWLERLTAQMRAVEDLGILLRQELCSFQERNEDPAVLTT